MTSLHGNIFSVTGPVIDGLSLAITPRADIAGVGHQSLNDATALLVDPQRALWALGVANTHTADTTGVLVKFHDYIMANTGAQVIFMLTQSHLLSIPALHAFELGDTPLLCVCGKHQVIRVEKLPWHTWAELTRKRFQHQGDEQWAKDRALIHQIPCYLHNGFCIQHFDGLYQNGNWTYCQLYWRCR